MIKVQYVVSCLAAVTMLALFPTLGCQAADRQVIKDLESVAGEYGNVGRDVGKIGCGIDVATITADNPL